MTERYDVLPPPVREAHVPRYFFHVSDGRDIIDPVGSELSGLSEARSEAVRTAGELIRDLGDELWTRRHWQMTVTDHLGHTLFSLRFGAEDYSWARRHQ